MGHVSHMSDGDVLYLRRSYNKFISGYVGRLNLRPNHENAHKWLRQLKHFRSCDKMLLGEMVKRGIYHPDTRITLF